MENQPSRTTIKQFEDAHVPGRGIEVTGVQGKPSTYSLSFYTTLTPGRNGPFMRANGRVENALATVDMAGMRFARLIDEALLFVQSELQADADAYIERKQTRETRGETQNKQPEGLSKFSKGSKTAREADKHNRHLNNLAARRSQDQERTSMSKSGRTR